MGNLTPKWLLFPKTIVKNDSRFHETNIKSSIVLRLHLRYEVFGETSLEERHGSSEQAWLNQAGSVQTSGSVL